MMPYTLWLVIETLSFYLYIGAVVLYTAGHMINHDLYAKKQSDILKGITDWIEYDTFSLHWFAFDFQMIAVPPFLMWWIYKENMNLKFSQLIKFQGVMAVLWLMHVASFFINRYSFSRKIEKEEDNDSNY